LDCVCEYVNHLALKNGACDFAYNDVASGGLTELLWLSKVTAISAIPQESLSRPSMMYPVQIFMIFR
jgi:hypothetical protein